MCSLSFVFIIIYIHRQGRACVYANIRKMCNLVDHAVTHMGLYRVCITYKHRVCITKSFPLRLGYLTALVPHPLDSITSIFFKLVWLLL